MPAPPSEAETILDAELQADGVDRVELNVPEAQVTLRPHDANRVHVRGFVPTSQPDSNQNQPDLSPVSTDRSDDRLHIFRQVLSTDVTDWRWRFQHWTTIHLDIRLPAHLDVKAQAPGGAIDAASLEGSLEVLVPGGSVQVEHMSGPLRLRGSGGALTARSISASRLDVQWAAGPVTLQQITGAQTTLEAQSAPTAVRSHQGPLEVQVHGASLTLTDLDGPCNAEVRGSSLTYRGAPTADTSLRTVGDAVQVQLPPAHAASLTAKGARVALDEAFDFEGRIRPHRIEGTLNGGGPALALQAIQGEASCRVQNEA